MYAPGVAGKTLAKPSAGVIFLLELIAAYWTSGLVPCTLGLAPWILGLVLLTLPMDFGTGPIHFKTGHKVTKLIQPAEPDLWLLLCYVRKDFTTISAGCSLSKSNSFLVFSLRRYSHRLIGHVGHHQTGCVLNPRPHP